MLHGVIKGMSGGVDLRGAPLHPHHWGPLGVLSPRDQDQEPDREHHGHPASERALDNPKAHDVTSSEGGPAGFPDLSRVYQSMAGNGVNFPGSLQAFVDGFALNSVKRDEEVRESWRESGARSGENGEEEEVADRKPPKNKPPRSQYEPLDLSYRPDSGSLPGSSVTVRDDVVWHSCLFCSFTTPSVEIMALHLDAHHLAGQPKRKEGGVLDERGSLRDQPWEAPSVGKSGLTSPILGHGGGGMSFREVAQADPTIQQEAGKVVADEARSPSDRAPRSTNSGGFEGNFLKPSGLPGPPGFGDEHPEPSELPTWPFDLPGASRRGEDAVEAPGKVPRDNGMEDSEEEEEQPEEDTEVAETASKSPESQGHEEEMETEEEEEQDDDCGSGGKETREQSGSPEDSEHLSPATPRRSPPLMEMQWQGPGLRGPPERPMNTLSVLKAYSAENLASFNGLGESAGGPGAAKRTDPASESAPPQLATVNT